MDEWYKNISTMVKPHNSMHLLTDPLPVQERKPGETLCKECIAADS